MKDIISKATFGFLMAQAFPGAVAIFGLGFAYFSLEERFPRTSLLDAAARLLQVWGAATIPQQAFLIALCVGAGMFIHGVHWATLGALEHREDGAGRSMSVFESRWHMWPIGLQIALGAGLLLWETLLLVGAKGGIDKTRIDENAAQIDSKDSYVHEFLQDFYLYSAQFFAHTAYALLILIVAAASYIGKYGYTGRRAMIVVLAYLVSSTFFVLARLQLSTLFAAERKLVARGEMKALGAE